MKQRLTIGTATLVALWLAACGAPTESGDMIVDQGGTIKVGVAVGLTGPLVEPSLDILYGIELATDDFNEFGGVQDHLIELVVEDDGCTPDGGRAAALRLTDIEDIVAIVGHVCSGASLAGAEIYSEARIPMMSPSSTSPALTATGLEIVNRTAWNDTVQGISSAHYVYDILGLRNAVVIHDDDAYGRALAQVFQSEFQMLGGDVQAFRAIDAQAVDYRPVLAELTAAEPDMIFYGGYDDQASLLVQQLREMDTPNVVFFSDDGVYTQAFLENAGSAAEGAYASFAAPPSGVAEALNALFDQHYLDTYGQAPDSLGPFHAHAHDAATIVFNAIEAVAEPQGRRLVINREDLISAIRETTEFRGLTGALSCNERGECGAEGTVTVVRVEDGQWVPVE